LIIKIVSFFVWILAKINAVLMKFAIETKVNIIKKKLIFKTFRKCKKRVTEMKDGEEST
jgi:hypothetical protein